MRSNRCAPRLLVWHSRSRCLLHFASLWGTITFLDSATFFALLPSLLYAEVTMYNLVYGWSCARSSSDGLHEGFLNGRDHIVDLINALEVSCGLL
jgi:hypothetical protein